MDQLCFRAVMLTVIAFVLSSCATQKRCFRKFPLEEKIVVKDSTVEKTAIAYRDTTVSVNLPADTVAVETEFKCDSIFEPVTVETQLARATVTVKDSKLRLELIQKDIELKFVFDSISKEIHYWKEKYMTEKRTIVREVTVKKVPLFAKIFAPVGIIAVLVVVIFVVVVAVRK